MNGFTRAICALVFLFAPALTVANELDESNGIYSVRARSLKWENVRSPLQAVSGSPLAKHPDDHFSFVVLEPGETTTIRVPRQELVRVLGMDGPLEEDQVEVWTSDGSALYRRLPLHFNACDGTFIAAPNQANASLAMIRAGGCHVTARLALFVSRHDEAPVVDEYKAMMCLRGAEPVDIRRRCEKAAKRFWSVPPNQAVTTSISGPVRLRFDTRFRFNDTESQSRQIYQLGVSGDDGLQRVLEFACASDLRQISHVNGVPKVLGAQAVNYLDLGAGRHQLTFDSTSPIYLRVDAKKCAYRHRFNELPMFRPSNYGPQGSTSLAPHIWQTPLDRLLNKNTTPMNSVALEQAAWISARDNNYREGGLKAYMLMRAAAAARTHQPEIRKLAERVRLQRTFFRNVLPSSQRFPIQARLGVFSTERLRDRDEDLPDVVLKDSIIDDAVAQLGRGYFVKMPTREAPSVYAIPSNLGASLLRVAVDRQSITQPTRFFVQFDDRSPIEMLVFPQEALCIDDYAPSRNTAALAAQQWRHGFSSAGSPANHGSLGGVYAREYQPAPHVAVATSEMILPSGVQRVSLWASDSGEYRQSPPQVALQYRATRPHLLTETNFESHWKRSQHGVALVLPLNGFFNPNQENTGRVSATSATPQEEIEFSQTHARSLQRVAGFSQAEITNMFVPLRRLMETHRRSFESSVVERPAPSSAKEISYESTRRLASKAERLVDDEQYAAAIEVWSQLADSNNQRVRAAALMSRVDTLRSGGELFLADRELRGLFLFDTDPRVRRLAYETLLAQLREDGESFEVEQLIATNWLRDPTNEDANDFAETLLLNGRYDLAMHCLLAIPREVRRHDLMARSALSQQWWKTFNAALLELPEPQQSVWRGRALLYRGSVGDGLAVLSSAGPDGERLVKKWQSGQRIREALQSPEIADRVVAVFAWEQWQANHPGPFKWSEEQSIVHQSPGYRAVYHRSRDVYSHYYLSQPNSPAKLRVFGPVKLKVETRPIHKMKDGGPIDGWVRVNDEAQELIYPISNDFPSSELMLVDDEQTAPGRLVNVELEFGPGMHEITVHSNEADLILRAFAQRPEVPLPVLPPINEATFVAAVSGQYAQPSFQGPSPHRLLILSNSPKSLQSVPLMRSIPTFQRPQSLEDCLLAMQRGRSQTASELLPIDGDAQQRMHRLVETVEHDDEQRIPAIHQAAQLVDSHPDCTDLRKQLGTLMKATTWQQFKEFESSAGVHSKAVTQWAPESPPLRIRQSLFRDKFEAEYAIIGERALVIDVQNKASRNYSVTLKYPLIGYLHHWPLTVIWQTDDAQERRFVLEPGKEKTIPVSFLSGQHKLRMSLSEQIPNHYVLVRLNNTNRVTMRRLPDLPNDSARVAINRLPSPESEHGKNNLRESPTSESTRERFYEVATRTEPIQFTAEGPAIFRVDELVGDVAQSRTIKIGDSKETITLSPEADREKGFFRVFELVANPAYERAPSKRVPKPTQPVADPLLAQCVDRAFDHHQDGIRLGLLTESQRDDPSSVAFALGLENANSPDSLIHWRDAAPLQGQVDRTWAHSVGLFQRRPVEESQDVAVPGQFLQADIARYAYDPWRDRYDETHAFVRMRNASGPTFGLTHEMRRTIQDVPALFSICSQCGKEPHPLNVFWKAASYLQVLDPTGNGDSVIWSGRLQGGLSRRYEINECWHHQPAVVGFVRPLTLRNSDAYQLGDVDQDLFTPYKAQHRWGLRFSDKFTLRRSVDSECWIRPSMTMNENVITPDNLGLQLGTTHLLGDIDFNASYRMTAFLRDDDRNRTSLQHVLYLDAVLERWQNRNMCHELGFSARYDIGNRGTSANLVWTVFAHDRRGYRDIHPRHTRFLPVKRQRAFRRGFLD